MIVIILELATLLLWKKQQYKSGKESSWDEMATPIGWTPVTGQFDDMKGTGSFKARDGYALYCEDYGKEKASTELWLKRIFRQDHYKTLKWKHGYV